jgi:hypothetical protein
MATGPIPLSMLWSLGGISAILAMVLLFFVVAA